MGTFSSAARLRDSGRLPAICPPWRARGNQLGAAAPQALVGQWMPGVRTRRSRTAVLQARWPAVERLGSCSATTVGVPCSIVLSHAAVLPLGNPVANCWCSSLWPGGSGDLMLVLMTRQERGVVTDVSVQGHPAWV